MKVQHFKGQNLEIFFSEAPDATPTGGDTPPVGACIRDAPPTIFNEFYVSL